MRSEFFSSRSGIENAQYCDRRGYLNQFHAGWGIQKVPVPYWLDVGSAVHLGLAHSLKGKPEEGIKAALQYWADSGQRANLNEVNWIEQELLIEGLLRVFNLYTLPAFLERFAVLAVEEEVLEDYEINAGSENGWNGWVTMHRMSRPDALVMDRQNGEIALISWKTIDTPTEDKRSEFRIDLQGIMETHYGRQWLEGRKKHVIKSVRELLINDDVEPAVLVKAAAMLTELTQSAGAAPKIDYVQTIFLVKGPRTRIAKSVLEPTEEDVQNEWLDTLSDTEEYGKAWRQDSFLLYPYIYSPDPNAGKASNLRASRREELGAAAPLSWAYKYQRPGNKTKSTIGADYKRQMVGMTCDLSMTQWVQLLNDRKVFPTTFDDALPHPFESIVFWEIPRYVTPTMEESVIRQTFESEMCRITSYFDVLYQINENPDAFILALDQNFPQKFVSCRRPYRCEYYSLCHEREEPLGPEEVPEGYQVRVPHHEVEYDIWLKSQSKEG